MSKKRKRSATSEALSGTAIDNTAPRSKQLMLSTLTALESSVCAANAFPNSKDLDFVCTAYPSVHRCSRTLSRRIVATIRAISSRYLSNHSATDCVAEDAGDADSTASFVPYDEVYGEVTQIMDDALEQFNAALDGARGIQNAVVPLTGGIGPEFKLKTDGIHTKGAVGKEAWIEMEKPQLSFHDYPIDNSDTPFVSSYGNKEEGDETVGLYMVDLFKANSQAGVGGPSGARHPYEDEIVAAAQEMGKKQFQEANTVVFDELDRTPCTLVDSESELFELAERLKKVAEIAVDVENHSVRSFQGFTCLIQISTRREDYVIDALALRQYIHRALAPVFSDGATVKVMHGADKDVQWLERDFGIYIVNMFDTGQAARVLKFPSAALSYLLARFCSVTSTDKKKFQLADWRQRPLPEDMYRYARSDTHYLLYIYDRLRTELTKKQLLLKVWERSAAVARKRYSKFCYDAGMPRQLAAKYGLGFDRHQMLLLEELYRWRDRKAREEDESLNYVAPVRTLFGIVRARDHARTVKGLLGKGFPSSKAVPPMIVDHAEELIRLISDALDTKLDDEEEKEEKEDRGGAPSLANKVGSTQMKVVIESESQVASGEVETRRGASDGISRVEKRPGLQLAATNSVSVKVPELKKSVLLSCDSSDSEADGSDARMSWGRQMNWKIDYPDEKLGEG